MDYLNLLVDTKKEFSLYLVNNLSPEISKGINSIYVNCNSRVNNNDNILIIFQQILSEVPQWNNNIIYTETNRIKKKIPYIEDLLTAVFISNMRLLCSIKNKNKQIKVRVPKMETFIHKCYIEVAKQFWSYTYLFNQNINKLEIQKNNRQIDIIIKNSIEEVIRKLLPIKSILKDYLETNFDTETNIESDLNTPLIDIINKKSKTKKDYLNEETNINNSIENNIENNTEYFEKKENDNKDYSSEDKNMIGGNIEINEELFLNTLGNNDLIIDAPNVLYNENSLNENSLNNNITNNTDKIYNENIVNKNSDNIKIVSIEGGQNEKIEEQLHEKKDESTNKMYENKFETHKTN